MTWSGRWRLVVAGSILWTGGFATSCRGPAPGPHGAVDGATPGVSGLARPAVIAAGEGERRLLRGGTAPLLIKIDPLNHGSQRMVLGSSDLPPGDEIGAHRHLAEDEIILITRGTARVRLGGRDYTATAGGAVFIPQGTCIAVSNVGADTLTTYFIFSSPGFEQVLREVSTIEGEPPKRLTPAERTEAFAAGHAEASPAGC